MNTIASHWEKNEKAVSWEEATKPMIVRAAESHTPIGGTFELTAMCNLRCKMCYVRLDRARADQLGLELTTEEWLAVAREALRLGTLNLLLTGGDPMIRPDFPELYTELAKMGFIITLNTNATLMTPALRDLFCKYPPTCVNVTVYGGSPETYGSVCGSPSGYKRLLRGMELLAEVPTTMEVRATFIRDNRHELEAIRAMANRYTKRFAINTQICKAVRGALSDVESCRLTPEEAMDLVEQNKLYYRRLYQSENRTESEAEAERRKQERLGKIQTNAQVIQPEIFTCYAAKCMYSITWDGKMIPCLNISEPYTLPLAEGFESAWNNLPGLYANLRAPEKCISCEFNGACPNCPGNLQAETGSLEREASYLCEYAVVRQRRIMQYREKVLTSNEFAR